MGARGCERWVLRYLCVKLIFTSSQLGAGF